MKWNEYIHRVLLPFSWVDSGGVRGNDDDDDEFWWWRGRYVVERRTTLQIERNRTKRWERERERTKMKIKETSYVIRERGGVGVVREEMEGRMECLEIVKRSLKKTCN